MDHILNINTLIHLILVFWWYFFIYFYYKNLNNKKSFYHNTNNDTKALYENDYKEKNTHKMKFDIEWNIIFKRNIFLDFEYILSLMLLIPFMVLIHKNIYFMSFSIIFFVILIHSYFKSIKKYKNTKFDFKQEKIEIFNVFYRENYDNIYYFNQIKWIQIIDKSKNNFLSIPSFELNLLFKNSFRINLLENSDINYIYEISEILSNRLKVSIL